jgi:hypothetical protein
MGGEEYMRAEKNILLLVFRATYYENIASYKSFATRKTKNLSQKFLFRRKVANFVMETYNSYYSRLRFDS